VPVGAQPPGRHALLGRDEEVAALEALAATEGGPAALVIEGEAGIGKTALWTHGLDEARRRSLRTLACRPRESEAELPFVALGDLLETVGEETLASLAEPQRRALEAALLRAEPTAPVEELSVFRGLLGVLRMLAAQSPVLVAVDDVQWADRGSVQALEFAVRRLDDLPIRFLVARRSSGEESAPLGLDRAIAGERFHGIQLEALGLEEIDLLVRDRLGVALAGPAVARVHEVSGGNPFFALELARALRDAGSTVVSGPLPVSGSLRELVRNRVTELPEESVEALTAAACLAVPTIARVEAVVPNGTASLVLAEKAGIVETGDDRVRFTHPLLASAVVGILPAQRLRDLHGRLAEVAEDEEQRARHLAAAASGPDAAVAAALADAARSAFERGAPAAAAELAHQSSALTPSDADDLAHARKLDAAEYAYLSGDVERLVGIANELIDELPPGEQRATAILLREETNTEDFEAGARALREAIPQLSEPRFLLRAHNLLAEMLMRAGDVPAAIDQARNTAALAMELGNERARVQALGILCGFETYSSEFTPGLMEHALELERHTEGTSFHYSPLQMSGHRLVYNDRLDEAREIFTTVLDATDDGEDDWEHVILLGHLVQLEIRAGNWRHAEERLRQYRLLADRLEFEAGHGHYLHALVDAHLGRVDGARAEAEQGRDLAHRGNDALFEMMSLWVLGFLELSLGNAEAAATVLAPLPDAMLAMGYRHPGVRPLLPDAIEALIGVGRLEEAESLLPRLEEPSRRLDIPWGLGAAARLRALLLASRGELEAALDATAEALEAHERAVRPLELGRTLLAKGTIERRAKRRAAARTTLEKALEIFDQVGAPLWAEKAASELARISGRQRSQGGLTETERRVAELVAEGKSNKEAAAALFVTVRTVEANLSKVYAKLGIRSRTELARRLDAPE
jgi:DNA-binding CsgD family transcriptional regulator